MILLTGITGNVGGATAAKLTQQGVRFRALVRSPEKVQPAIAQQCDVIQGDLSDADGLAAALDGVERMLLVTPNNEKQAELEKSVVDAAAKAGVAQMVKISSIEAGPKAVAPVAKLHYEGEQYIDQHIKHAAFLRPTFYMQTLFTIAQPVKTAGVLPMPLGDTSISMIDVRDLAAAAAKMLVDPIMAAGTFPVTGCDPITLSEIAATMSKVLDREVKYVDMPDDDYRTHLNKILGSAWHVNAICTLFQEIKAGALNHEFPNVADISGSSATPFEQFVQDHTHIFNP